MVQCNPYSTCLVKNISLSSKIVNSLLIHFILFLTMQSGLIETRTTYLNALFDYYKAIITLEAVSGIDQALDLLYQFEF